MKKVILLIILQLITLYNITANIYNLKELGADTSGKNKCTDLINKTIEKAHAEGGGTLYFPAGEYLTAAINMKSNITLHVEAGAVIRFSDQFQDYMPFMRVRWEGIFMNTFAPLINARNAQNISITGRGTLDGQ